MTSLKTIILDDDDLTEIARYLPVSKVRRQHIRPEILDRLSKADIVILDRPDASACLRNKFRGVDWATPTPLPRPQIFVSLLQSRNERISISPRKTAPLRFRFFSQKT